MEAARPDEIEISRANRAKFLSSAYDLCGRSVHQTISLQEAGKAAGVSDYDEILAVASYLESKGLFDLDGGGWTGRMTVSGIDLIENSRKPSPQAESTKGTVNNTLNIFGPVHGSNIVQGDNNSVFLEPCNIKKLSGLLDQLATHVRIAMQNAHLVQQDQQDINSSLGAMQYEAKTSRPKKSVLKAHLETILQIFKVSGTAASTLKGVVEAVNKIHALFHH